MKSRLIFPFVVVLLLGCSLIQPAGSRNLEVTILNNEIRELARKYDIDVIDTYALFYDDSESGRGELYQADSLHISTKGYELWIDSGLTPYLQENDFESIGMIGNSITAGIENWVWDESISSMSNWELFLKKPTINYGIGGNTSYDILQRLDTILEYPLDLYFLMVGINDINKGVPLWQSVENIEDIITTITDCGATVVIQLVLPVIE